MSDVIVDGFSELFDDRVEHGCCLHDFGWYFRMYRYIYRQFEY